ncbi:MAG: heme exporter protein A [Hyphomicrobiaceae bacterium]
MGRRDDRVLNPATTNNMALVVRNLQCRYGVRTILDGLDLDLANGKALALLGPNGAGKTTLLRVLAGLLRPREGSVQVLGTQLPGDTKSRSRIGLVMHEGGFYADLSAIENLVFFAKLAGLPAIDRRDRAAASLNDVGLSASADARAGDFSRGMKQRLAIARALLVRPDLLLLDEPFTGLDRQGARSISKLLAAQKSAGTTLVMVLHEVERATALADEAAILVNGRIGWNDVVGDADGLAQAYDETVGYH